MFGLRWHWGRSTRDAYRDLLDGDLVFFEGDGDGDGGDDGGQGDGGSQDGDGDGDGGQGDGGSQDGGDGDGGDRSGSDGDDQDKKTVSHEEARKLRSEARGLRKRLKDAEDRAKKLEDKDATELEKSQRTAESEKEARAKAEVEVRKLRVQVAATKVGIRPEAAAVASGLVDWDDIDPDDESAVTDALKGLKDEHGYLFSKDGVGDIGAGKRDRKESDDDDVAPGQGRLEQAYADAK